MINNFIKTELREVNIINLDKVTEGTKIKYYERTMYQELDEEWSWSYIGEGEVTYVCEDQISFEAGDIIFHLDIEELQDGFHRIEIIA